MQSMLDAFWNAGNDKFEPREAIRVRALNVIALTITVAAIPPIALMFADGDDGWVESARITLWLVLALQPIFFAHYFGFLAKALYFFIWLVCFVVVEASFGRINGTHIILLVMPAVAVYVLGVQRWPLAATLSIISAALFVAVEYFVPLQIGWHQSFFDVILAQMPQEFAPGIRDLIFVSVVTGTEVMLFLGAFLTLSALRQSEDALSREYARSELLLANMLPSAISDRLKSNPDQTIADSYPDVSILFADLVGFTNYSSIRRAGEVVNTLSTLFHAFDNLVEDLDLEKIKTVGDAYMVAGGLDPEVPDHSVRIAELALRMIETTDISFNERGIDMTLRIGIHRGPAVAGVVGSKRTFFDVWGDTVNVASRMEAAAPAGTVQVTRELMDVLQDQFRFEPYEDIDIKGKGRMQRYRLVGRD